jgi:hypothetical protein
MNISITYNLSLCVKLRGKVLALDARLEGRVCARRYSLTRRSGRRRQWRPVSSGMSSNDTARQRDLKVHLMYFRAAHGARESGVYSEYSQA